MTTPPRKPSSQPSRFTLPRIEPWRDSNRARFRASSRGKAKFAAQSPFRFRARPSLPAASGARHRPFAMLQRPRTMQLSRAAPPRTLHSANSSGAVPLSPRPAARWHAPCPLRTSPANDALLAAGRHPQSAAAFGKTPRFVVKLMPAETARHTRPTASMRRLQ